MKQYSFSISSLSQLADSLQAMKEKEETFHHPLIHIFCTKEISYAEKIRDTLKQYFPDSSILGISTQGATVKGTLQYPAALITFMEFQNVKVHFLHTASKNREENESRISSWLRSIEQPAGLEVWTCSLNEPVPFDKALFEKYPFIPLFGGRAASADLTAPTYILDDTRVYSSGFYFCCYDGPIHIMTHHVLGWVHIGRPLKITGTDGPHTITEIDGKPALDIYRKYLHIHPNEYFYSKAAAFPLLVRRGDVEITAIPLGYGSKGELYMAGSLEKGDIVHLSFESPDRIRKELRIEMEKIHNFCPEGVLLISSAIRALMLRESMNMPLTALEKIRPSAGGLFYGEIMKTGGRIYHMTMTSVIILFREERKNKISKVLPAGKPRFLQGKNKKVRPGDPLSTIRHLSCLMIEATAELEESYRKLTYTATHDGLTRILNRGAIEKMFYEFRAKEDTADFCAIMVDLDQFKSINDTYGHHIGDQVLSETARILTAHLRSHDQAGRWGGDEFLILLPHVSLEDASRIAERLRAAIYKADILPPPSQITASFGTAQVLPHEEPDDFYKRIDHALYQAKGKGKNRVITIK
ncbi:sensor domain-containing diguanylate cyclase [Dialister sp.]|uniref:sensor domain-containing diguanylate cyclase n=1 Tax=Dialister sp. TaxID=1955814 RepID=UPI003EFF421E